MNRGKGHWYRVKGKGKGLRASIFLSILLLSQDSDPLSQDSDPLSQDSDPLSQDSDLEFFVVNFI